MGPHRRTGRRALATLLATALAAGLLPASVLGASPNDPAAAGGPPTKVIVTFHQKPGQAAEHAIVAAGGQVRFRYTIIPALAATVPAQAVEGLRHNPLVEAVETDGHVTILSDDTPTGDLEYDNAWGVRHIETKRVHDSGNWGAGVKVAVIDSGIDYVHFDLSGPQPVYPEFNGNYRGGWDFVNNDNDPIDDNGHGTHVSGILAADKNGYLVVGVAPQVDLYVLKVVDASGNGDYSSVIAALQWAVDEGINVVNMSIGGHEASQALAEAVEAAYRAHVLMVAAAGNVNPASWIELIYGCPVVVPAAYPHVLATTYTNISNELTGFSCTGSQVDFAAPGDQVFSPVPVGTCMLCSPYGYQPLSGTSMASPHLAGLVALVLSHGIRDANDDGLLFDEVKAHLCSSTDPGGRIATTDPRYPNWYGCGVINAGKALVDNPPPVGPAPNLPPVAVADTASTAYQTQVTVAVLANDSDPDGGTLSVTSVTTPTHGTATINAGTTVTYTPAAGYSGPDSFGYSISDGQGGTASATVSITVGPAPTTVMHIGDLDRSASKTSRKWTAQVLVLVLDQFGLPVAGVTVNGTWSGAAKGGGSCITTAGGTCTIAKSDLSLAKTSITFTVTAVAKTGATYDRTKNVDADQPPDSNGTVITISRP